MAKQLRVLILEDNPSDAELVLHALRRAGYDPIAHRVETEPDYRDRLRTDPEVILADYSLPEFDALHALTILQDCRQDIPFIIVTGTIVEEHAVQVMQLGASDYILKDRLGRLGQAVSNALEKKLLREEARLAERRLAAQHATTQVLADSPSLEEAFARIIRAVCESMEWIWAAVWMADARLHRLALKQSWQAPAADLDGFAKACRDKTFARGEGLPGRVWASGEPAWVPDVMRDDNYFGKHAEPQAGLRGVFVCPISIDRDVVGVIEFMCESAERRNEKILAMMKAIGSQIGQFIQRKRVEEGLRLFRALIDRTSECIKVIDADTGRFLDVNETACATYGYTRDQFLGLKALRPRSV